MSAIVESNGSWAAHERLSDLRWAIMPQLVRLTLFASVVGNGIDIARVTDRSEGVSLSFQVVLRIVTTLSASLCGAWGWWRLPEVRQALMTRRGIITGMVIVGAYAAVATAPSPNVAFFVATAFAVYTLLTLTSLVLFGLTGTLWTALIGLWCYVIISWALWFTVPSLATFNEYLNSEETLARFGGLGHPNVLAAIQCLGFVLTLMFVQRGRLAWQWLIPAALLFAATLIQTKSRTPVIATAVCLMATYAGTLRWRETYLLAGFCVCMLGVGLAVIEADYGLDRTFNELSVRLTKTGSMDELTSATGRTEIWGRAIELISHAPLTGYGGGSSSQVMIEHSGHAHNLLLETALLFGIPVAILFFMLLCVNVKDAIENRFIFVRQFTIYLLMLGLVESPLFGLVPDPSMCIWLACLFGPIIATPDSE